MNNQIYILKQSCRIYGGLHIKITCKVDSINTFFSRQVNNDTYTSKFNDLMRYQNIISQELHHFSRFLTNWNFSIIVNQSDYL